MASIYLDKYINTKKESKTIIGAPIFVDLHLDLTPQQTIGIGTSTKPANDILVDIDEVAIKNSVYNLLTMKGGSKILSPWINTALEQYLFEPISDIRGEQIGQNMVSVLEKYEPRIDVLKVDVIVDIDLQTYILKLFYRIKAKSSISSFSLSINNGQIIL